MKTIASKLDDVIAESFKTMCNEVDVTPNMGLKNIIKYALSNRTTFQYIIKHG